MTTPTPATLNIVETAQSVSDLSILVDAVVQAGLVDALTASGNKTVLAPTNAAFTADCRCSSGQQSKQNNQRTVSFIPGSPGSEKRR